MAIIRNQKFHLWIQRHDSLIEKLRLDYEAATGQNMEFDAWVEHFYHQSKASDTPLPSREELLFLVWIAENRTLLGKGHATQLEEATQSAVSSFNLDMYKKTEQGALELSDFIS